MTRKLVVWLINCLREFYGPFDVVFQSSSSRFQEDTRESLNPNSLYSTTPESSAGPSPTLRQYTLSQNQSDVPPPNTPNACPPPPPSPPRHPHPESKSVCLFFVIKGHRPNVPRHVDILVSGDCKAKKIYLMII